MGVRDPRDAEAMSEDESDGGANSDAEEAPTSPTQAGGAGTASAGANANQTAAQSQKQPGLPSPLAGPSSIRPLRRGMRWAQYSPNGSGNIKLMGRKGGWNSTP